MVKNKKYASCFLFILAIISIPAIFNFNFILYDKVWVHSLHQYHYVMFPVMVLLLVGNGVKIGNHAPIIFGVGLKILGTMAVAFVIALGINYARYDNMCYLHAEISQQQAMAYFTTLISDIHSTEGYCVDIPVCYINEGSKTASSSHGIATSDIAATNPYGMDPAKTLAGRIICMFGVIIGQLV